MNEQDAETNKGLKLLAKSSIIVFITIIFSKILFYLYRIVIAKEYNPEIYGLFTLSIILVGWFRVISNFGIKQGLLRYISLLRGKKENQKISYLFKISFILLILTSVLMGVLLFILSDFIAIKIFSNSNLTIFLKILSFIIPISVLGEALLNVIRAYEKIGWYSFIANIFGNSMQLIFLLIFIFFGMSFISVPLSSIMGMFSILVASYLVCRIKLPEIFRLKRKNKKNKKTFKEMFSYSWPFVFQGFLVYIFVGIDSFMIGILKNAEQVGFYNAAVPIANTLFLFFSLFGQLFFPLVTKEFSKGHLETVKQLSQQISKWIFMMTLPFLVLFIVFPGIFINLLFGSEYLIAENSLRFLSIGTLFLSISSISQELISMKGKSKIILFDIICASVFNIIFNLIFIRLYGITGAAFATMLSSIFLAILLFVQSYKYLNIIPLRRKMFRIILITLIPLGFLLFFKSFLEINTLTLICCGIFFFAVYTLLILITGCLDKNDWYILKIFFKKLGIKK